MNLETVSGVGFWVTALVFCVVIGSFPKGRCSEKMQGFEKDHIRALIAQNNQLTNAHCKTREFFHLNYLEKQSCRKLKMVCAWPLPKGKLF